MFKKKIRKQFHVSTSTVYFPGRKSTFKRLVLFMRPQTKRAVYRIGAGALLAL